VGGQPATECEGGGPISTEKGHVESGPSADGSMENADIRSCVRGFW
jgi:hypothetical protein